MKKFRFVSQSQQTECGLICTKMMLAYYGLRLSLTELRERYQVGRNGLSLLDIRTILEDYGMVTRSLKFSAEEIIARNESCIVFWENRHFIIYEQFKKNYVIVVDPAIGRRKISIEEFTKGYSNAAIYSIPGENFKKENHEKNYLKIFLPVIFQNKVRYITLGLCSILVYLLSIVSPEIMKNLVNSIGGGQNSLPHFTKLFIIFSILTIVITYAQNILLIKMRIYIDKSIIKKTFRDLLDVTYNFFETRNNMDIIYTLRSTSVLKEMFTNQIVNGVIQIGAVIFYTIYFMHYSLPIGIISLSIFVINLAFVALTNSSVIDSSKNYITEESKVQGIYMESVQSMLNVKMTSSEDEVFENWEKQFDIYQKKLFASEKIGNSVNIVSDIFKLVSPLIILLFSLYMVIHGNMSLGLALSLYSVSGLYFGLVDSVFNTYWSYAKCSVYMERLADISTSQKENCVQKDLIKHTADGNIELKNVSFSYGNSKDMVLNDISMSIKKGEKIALVGKSGSGKSTLAKIIIGLYSLESGHILYDGIDTSELDMRHLRQQFGIVPQNVRLFNKSIYENIVLNRKNISQESVEKCASIVNIHSEIEKMPMKYNTLVSDAGDNLSGGQCQRIILARALINNPKIIVFDEATSSLDNINEEKLTQYLKNKGCTSIIVAHRLSTIVNCDKIYVLDNGRIVESGTHDELIHKNGEYSKLYNIKAS